MFEQYLRNALLLVIKPSLKRIISGYLPPTECAAVPAYNPYLGKVSLTKPAPHACPRTSDSRPRPRAS